MTCTRIYRPPLLPWLARLRLVVGPDRQGHPSAEVCLGAREAPDDLIEGGSTFLALTWGCWSVPAQLDRDGCGIGRLWVEWPWLAARLAARTWLRGG